MSYLRYHKPLQPLPIKTRSKSTTSCSGRRARRCVVSQQILSIWVRRLDSSACSTPGSDADLTSAHSLRRRRRRPFFRRHTLDLLPAQFLLAGSSPEPSVQAIVPQISRTGIRCRQAAILIRLEDVADARCFLASPRPRPQVRMEGLCQTTVRCTGSGAQRPGTSSQVHGPLYSPPRRAKTATNSKGDPPALPGRQQAFDISCSRAPGAPRRSCEREPPSARTQVHRWTSVGAPKPES